LANRFGIPLLHLDNVHFFDQWQERPIEEENRIVRTFLSENESWVIDGNYNRVAPERFAQSDVTIYLNYNRLYCYLKSFERYRANRGKTRSSCGCIEKFDGEFQRWILFEGRTKKRRISHLSNLSKTPGRQLVFKNVRQLEKWLSASGIEQSISPKTPAKPFSKR
jgi:adenylate kinase family enzyme